MDVEVTRTYLQLEHPEDLNAARIDDSRVRIENLLECPASFYRYLYAEVGRFYMGTEISPIRPIVLRAGGTVDTQGKMSMSTGVGIYLLKTIQGEIAYSYNAFPEVRREFGAAHLISLSIIGVW